MLSAQDKVEGYDRRLACARHYLELDEAQGVTEDREARLRGIAYWQRRRDEAAAQLPQQHMAPILAGAPRSRR